MLGVDIAKRKFDVALLINDKLKHKVFKNNQEGFTELSSLPGSVMPCIPNLGHPCHRK